MILAMRNSSNRKRRTRGFTLVELMIAVAVIALLSMIAVPSFMQNIRKSKRTDAQVALTRVSTNLERFFSANGTYTTDAALLGVLIDADDVAFSDDGHYVMTVTGGATGIASSYTVTATAAAGSMQTDDKGCTVLTVNSLGQRTPSPRTSRCW